MTPFQLNAKGSYDNDGNLLTTDQFCGKYELVSYGPDGTILASEVIEFNFDQSTSVVDAAVATQFANLGVDGADIGDPLVCLDALSFDKVGEDNISFLTISAKIWSCDDPEPDCEEAYQANITIHSACIPATEITNHTVQAQSLPVPTGCTADFYLLGGGIFEVILRADQDVTWDIIDLDGSTHILNSSTPTEIKFLSFPTGSFPCGDGFFNGHFIVQATSCDGSILESELVLNQNF